WQFFLPARTAIHFVIFDPVSGLVAHGYERTAASGQDTRLNVPVFQACTAPDGDGDGLPDDVEFAIGSNPRKADTDGDGIDDFWSVQLGLDPLGGRGQPPGVVANLALPGTANAVTVAGSSLRAEGQTAYLAAGAKGLAIVDASQPLKPVLLGQL